MAKGLGVKPLLLPVPVGLMILAARLLGKSEVAKRLLGDLEVDIAHTKEVLGWEPPFSVEASFEKMFECR